MCKTKSRRESEQKTEARRDEKRRRGEGFYWPVIGYFWLWTASGVNAGHVDERPRGIPENGSSQDPSPRGSRSPVFFHSPPFWIFLYTCIFVSSSLFWLQDSPKRKTNSKPRARVSLTLKPQNAPFQFFRTLESKLQKHFVTIILFSAHIFSQFSTPNKMLTNFCLKFLSRFVLLSRLFFDAIEKCFVYPFRLNNTIISPLSSIILALSTLHLYITHSRV